MWILVDATNPENDRHYSFAKVCVPNFDVREGYDGPVDLKYVQVKDRNYYLENIRYMEVDLYDNIAAEEWLRTTYWDDIERICEYESVNWGTNQVEAHTVYAHLLCKILCTLFRCEAVWHLAE